MRSLRIRLIFFLGLAILVAAGLQFAASFHAATIEANKLFDYHMRRMAIALQDNRFDKVGDEVIPIGDNIQYDFVMQFWDDTGTRVFQSRNFLLIPEQGQQGFSEVTLANGEWRVYMMRSENRVIQVAQKLDARTKQAISMALRASWPILPVSLLLFITAWWVVTSAVSPINRLGQELAGRNADVLSPVSIDGIPDEISALVAELNSLLGRVSLAFQSQHRFVADAAHELRSPLTALKLQIHTLTRARDDKARKQAIERLERGMERASRLVEQLLALAKHDPQSQAAGQGIVSLIDPVELAVSDVALLAELKNIRLGFGNAALAAILGNVEDLRVLARNLIDNAIRYTPEGGLVQIDVDADSASATLTIQDSGPGIEAADQERVFDRFFRVAGTEASGSGLGLAIVKAIADRHKGTIELGKAAIGGLKVKVNFPLHPSGKRIT